MTRTRTRSPVSDDTDPVTDSGGDPVAARREREAKRRLREEDDDSGSTEVQRRRGADDDDPSAEFGDKGKNLMLGGNGRDDLRGLAGNDTLKDRGGADELDGGAGNDRLVGGRGADVFEFDRKDGRDVIGDFQHGVDRIELDDSDFGFGGVADVLDLATQRGDNVVFKLGQGTVVVVRNTTVDAFDAEDFIL